MSNRGSRSLAGRLANTVGHAVVHLVDDAQGGQQLQIELLADEVMDEVERHQDYGLTSVPLPGASAVTLAVGGTRGRSIALAVGDRRYRLTGLAAGEVALHDDQGQKVHLTRDGIVIQTAKALSLVSGEDFHITAPSMTADIEGAVTFNCGSFAVSADDAATIDAADIAVSATASVTIEGASAHIEADPITLKGDHINLGDVGGLAVARKTDAVAGGAITGGSTKVFAK